MSSFTRASGFIRIQGREGQLGVNRIGRDESAESDSVPYVPYVTTDDPPDESA
jgi:hypothetical protein